MKQRRLKDKLSVKIVVMLGGSSAGLTAFYMYKRLRVVEKDFFGTLGQLVNQGYVLFSDDDRLVLSEKGFELYCLARSSVVGGAKPWRRVPDHMRDGEQKVGGFYIPDFELFLRSEGLSKT